MKNNTKTNKCALFIFDGYADWEASLVTAYLNSSTNYEIITFSVYGKPVTSMAGLRVVPDFSHEQISYADFDLLILPGGTSWEHKGNQEIFPLIIDCVANSKIVAAICAATLMLGSLGILNNIQHTSNYPEYLQAYCHKYRGGRYYVNQPCVYASKIITANGTAMIEFAYEILKALNVMDEKKLEDWKALYKSGGMITDFFIQSIPA